MSATANSDWPTPGQNLEKAIKCKFLMTSNMHMLKQGHLNEHWNQSLFPSGLRIFKVLKQYLLCFKLFKFVEKK